MAGPAADSRPYEVSNLRNSRFKHFRFEVLTAVLLNSGVQIGRAHV
jgi:hypothetical protein